MRSFILFLFVPLYSFSQSNYIFQHLTVEDGLLSNFNVNTFQDAEGFYWFSSPAGIQRFDGKNFITYHYNDNAAKTITGDWAGKPVEDGEKNIWVINDDGINIYQRKHGTISRLYINDAADSNTNNVCNIIKDGRDQIWIVTNRNIFQYNYGQQKAVLVKNVLNDVHDGIVGAISNTKRNNFWLLVSRNGFYEIACYDIIANKITYASEPGVKEFISNQKTIAFFKSDESNNLWISDYWGTLFKYNTITKNTSHYVIAHQKGSEKRAFNYGKINDCLDDNKGTIWFGGENTGLLKYDKNTDSFTTLPSQNGSEYDLHCDQTISSFFEDREANIWINTDLGMNIFNPHQQRFKYLNTKTELPILQFNANVTSIFESNKKDIWVSTWGNGIYKYDSNFILRNNYVYEKNNAASFGEPLNRAWAFGEDYDGNIWVGAQYGMLSVLNPATGIFSNKIIPEFGHFTVMHIAKDKESNFWFGLFNGMLGKWDAASGTMAVYKDLYGSSCKGPTVVDGLLVDNENTVWVATSSYGLNRLNKDKKLMEEKALFPQHIFSVFPLNDSIIGGGTSGKGFFLFNKFSKTTKFYNTTNGLSSNIVFGGIPDNSNNIWIFANNGIERLNLVTKTIFHYDLNDGIKDHIFLRAFCKLKNGLFMVAANSGIIYFNPDSLALKTSPPDVMITNFSAGQQSFPIDSLLAGKTIDLSHDQNVIAIEYASISFIGRNTEQYFYKLDVIDRDWISAGIHRSVTYANLAPGKYVFEVRSQSADGVKSVHITRFNFTIQPPWWRTGWAYLIWVSAVLVIVYTVYKYRQRGRQALSNMRQRISSDLHDDIGSTLNSISVYSEIAGRHLEINPENAKSLLDKMGSTSRNMIVTMNDIVWAVNPKNDYFENILQRMQYFAGELLSGQNILLQFNADQTIKNIKLPMTKRKNFYLIFKEVINNSYKHAHCKTVNVHIGQQGNNIIMIITDDGRGFESPNAAFNSNGLKNMQIRSKEIGARLTITSWLMKGTRIELRLPL